MAVKYTKGGYREVNKPTHASIEGTGLIRGYRVRIYSGERVIHSHHFPCEIARVEAGIPYITNEAFDKAYAEAKAYCRTFGLN